MRTARLLPVSPSLHCSGGCTCLVEAGCTWSGGEYLVLGGVPGLGAVPGPRGVAAWSRRRVYLPGPGGCTYLVLGGVPAWSRGGTCLIWGWGGYLPRYSHPPPLDR